MMKSIELNGTTKPRLTLHRYHLTSAYNKGFVVPAGRLKGLR